jgi:hypothetical protein
VLTDCSRKSQFPFLRLHTICQLPSILTLPVRLSTTTRDDYHETARETETGTRARFHGGLGGPVGTRVQQTCGAKDGYWTLRFEEDAVARGDNEARVLLCVGEGI